jgi:pyruvate formate lyase activating enzyme
MASFIASINKNIPWHISAFHPDWKMLDKGITPLSTILKAYEI